MRVMIMAEMDVLSMRWVVGFRFPRFDGEIHGVVDNPAPGILIHRPGLPSFRNRR